MSLHESEKESLIDLLIKLRDLGNTVIVVEHDKHFINIADEVIDIGPGAGERGGEIVFQGKLDGLTKSKSITGQILKNEIKLKTKTEDKRKSITDATKFLVLRNINTHNLKDLKVKIPLEMFIGICGVSGSGKSSLIIDSLIPLIKPYFKKGNNKSKNDKNEDNNEDEDNFLDSSGKLEGYENIDEFIIINQKPIGRTRRSIPASYVGIWDKIRKLYSKLPKSKKQKFKPGHFSFNSSSGRCPVCKGDGEVDIEVSFLSDFTMPCKECKGKRYLPEILDIKYKGKSISDVLDLTVSEALELFKSEKNIAFILDILEQIGMGYITLGQSALTLSGGEAQRIKLARELGKAHNNRTLYILDEPTIGLSTYDAIHLIDVLDKLVDNGNSVIIIEHDPDILSYMDYLIELGPEGGPKGGEIIAKGTPEELKINRNSITGSYLKT